MLLRDPAVHDELKLTGDQVAAIEAAMAEIDTALWKLRDVPAAESGAQVVDLVGRVEATLPPILDDDQRKRLRQIVVQAQGSDALVSSEVAGELGLSAMQLRRVERILADGEKLLREKIEQLLAEP